MGSLCVKCVHELWLRSPLLLVKILLTTKASPAEHFVRVTIATLNTLRFSSTRCWHTVAPCASCLPPAIPQFFLLWRMSLVIFKRKTRHVSSYKVYSFSLSPRRQYTSCSTLAAVAWSDPILLDNLIPSKLSSSPPLTVYSFHHRFRRWWQWLSRAQKPV